MLPFRHYGIRKSNKMRIAAISSLSTSELELSLYSLLGNATMYLPNSFLILLVSTAVLAHGLHARGAYDDDSLFDRRGIYDGYDLS